MIAVLTFMMTSTFASAETLESYLAPQFDRSSAVGDVDINTETDLLSEHFYIDHHDGVDEKISAIVFFMARNHNHINGIKIEYSSGQVAQIGSTNGNSNRKNFSDNEYITDIKIFGKEGTDQNDCQDSGSRISKVRLKTTKNKTYWFGKNRGFDCSQSSASNHLHLIGLSANYNQGKILSLTPIWRRAVDLQIVEIEADETNNTEIARAVHVRHLVVNNTQSEQSESLLFETDVTESITNTWTSTEETTRTHGLTVGIEATYGAVTGRAEFAVELEDHFSETVGESDTQTTNKTIEDHYTSSLSPYTVYMVEGHFTMLESIYPYTVIYQDKNNCNDDGECQEFRFEGQLSEVVYSDEVSFHSTPIGVIEDGTAMIDAVPGQHYQDIIEQRFTDNYVLDLIYVDREGNEVELDEIE